VNFVIEIANMLLGGLAAGMVLFIVSVGLSVTMGLMGFVNLAHGAFAMLGGYVIVLSMRRCTVFGIVDVHSMLLGENSIFNSCVNVARRQLGCMRYCYVSTGCRTPRRHACQPDGVIAAVKARVSDPVKQASEIANEKLRVRPQFNAVRFGKPDYAQLAETCAIEITRGADDESEMGVFHDLFQPQREANLKARLEEYTPAGMDVGVFFAN